jgi:hypothetical protein
MDLVDKMGNHLLGNIGVIDHAISHRADRNNVPGGTSQHFLGLMANRQDHIGLLIYGNNGWLIDDYSLTPYINQRIGGSEINRQILGKKTEHSGKK